ncbi:hypothetical protein B9Q11_02920 [Candidatus Marsarchaeota G2 archaeon ECH_B_SAG-F08]|jgi:CBS domain-containing protein|uniref:CBS domain-containing protein n=6 Tax=Candidatus Marsarchaeota TaxID=1978152 RepID=A0A2R6C101_9ARCH|nr:MAG: hypothetical protein B9Q01_00815 [Candidatus Marsarchaeota G1 archaeon OSP_D]PSN85974.1 MAG: hypothetical protein B9Q02_04290 [Candidatus Marsarchaeota G1 archaeon BE_D]PSN89162.1 MAG: hypothetical protein B9Q00_02795 [Candidatus Marsarchaeota G1 archaeon OSP_C]PSN98075.1 MAG: hypothetical protein B9Q11_02920 [Candidatus Marsarchaeota G2 archaeon ECH_B_SAG-F08]PSO04568.1 MAG: hypothetical protein B9Q12_02205 [Candidatus Marsarchaeota G2 archaeon ECH_B_SAG-G06]PSO04816.1 MAG: hypothetic
MIELKMMIDASRPKIKFPTSRSSVIKEMISSRLPALPVFDKKENFLGVISVTTLLNNPDEEQLGLLIEKCDSKNYDKNLYQERVLNDLSLKGYSCVLDNEGKFIGIIYLEDILKKVLAKKDYDNIPIEGFVRKKFPVVWSSTPISMCWCTLRFSEFNSLLVVDDECKPFSVLTELDILMDVEEERISIKGVASDAGTSEEWGVDQANIVYIDRLSLKLSKKPVSSLIKPLTISVLSTESVSAVATKMVLAKTSILPVVDSSKSLIGIVQASDLLRALEEKSL